MTMFLVNTLGRLRLLEQFPASDTDREIIYPGASKTQVLEGPPGTEMILALAQSDGLVFGGAKPTLGRRAREKSTGRRCRRARWFTCVPTALKSRVNAAAIWARFVTAPIPRNKSGSGWNVCGSG